jgi:hypothetical protein
MRDSAGGMDLAECRRLVGPGLTDAELAALRDQMYGLARAICRVLPGANARPLSAAGLGLDELADAEERAAILEFEAGMPRAAAESVAVAARARNRRQ